MPNQRAKDRAFLGVFISKDLKRWLQENAQQAGSSVSALVASLLDESFRRTAKRGVKATSEKPASTESSENFTDQTRAYNASVNEDVWML